MNTDMVLTGILDMQGTLDQQAVRAEALSISAFPAIVEDFQRMSAQRFAEEGPGWAPLSPTTIALKERAGYAQPATPMVATGDLLYSLAGDTEHSVHEVTPDSVLMGTNLSYAQYHQDGPRQIRVFGRGSATLPRRPVVEVTEIDAARWGAIIAAAMHGAGL